MSFHRTVTRACCVLAIALLAACGPVGSPGDEPAPSAPASADGGVSVDAQGLAAADLDRGEVLSLACQACHSFVADQDGPLGPNLNGVFGRAAAMVPGFEYSAVMRASGIVWTPEALDAWLRDPPGFLPGTNMAFTGYGSARDRRDLIAYLMRATVAAEAR